jgi:signal transduction histidine kinase
MWQLLILLLLFSESALGRDIIISPDLDPVKVTTQAGITIDESSIFSINEIEKITFDDDYQNFNFGYSDATIWIKLNITNLLDSPDLIMHINNPSLDKITLLQQSHSAWIKTDLGDLQEFHQRLLNLPTFAIPIAIERNSSEVFYLRVESQNTLIIPITIFSKDEFNHYLYSHYVMFGALYGIPIGLLLYNLLIFLSIRKHTYLLYSLVIVSNTFLSLSWDGITYSLFPAAVYFQQRCISLAMCCCIVTLILFSKNFLRTKKNTPKIDSYLTIIAASAVLLSFLIFLPNHHLFYIPIVILATLMIPVLLAAGIVRIRQQYSPAKMYLLATSTLLIATALCSLSILNILPLQEEITYIFKVGVASELIILSLGLAAQIKALKASKQAAIEKVKSIEQGILENENLALSKANKLKDAFLSTISHELRTPMNGVQGALGLLEMEQDKSNRKELINTIRNSSDIMIKQVDRILLFTELKAGNITNKYSRKSIKSLINKKSTHWYEQCNNKSIKLEKHINFEKEISVDELKIDWILSEVVGNAIKFSSGGKISITADITDQNSLIISISDQGKGIPKELIAELTGSFRQEEEAFNRSHEGLGIGLSITSELVTLLAGQLTIKASDEFTTRVVIELPITNTELAINPALKKELKSNIFPLKVLIIEDNKINQIILEKILKQLGHHTAIANNGIEGYKAAKLSQFDLILMDCQMPNMDGFECTRLIRSNDNINRDTLIIAVTANASESNKEHCLASGMDNFRQKPIDPSIIKELLDQYFVPTR